MQNSITNFCMIPSDQTGTIYGAWSATPIPIAFHSGDFSSSELLAMTNAADTWNQFFQASLTLSTLDYGGNASVPRSVTTTDSGSFCTQSIFQSSQYTGYVVIYKRTTWPASYPSTAIAITTDCSTPHTPYPTFYMGVMEINYQDFFTTGTPMPDLQSIVLHELGHLHGLKHSCEFTTQANTPNCSNLNMNGDYRVASMYPSFSFDTSGSGEQRRSLNVNDQERANCLYTGPNGPAPIHTAGE